MKRRILCNFEMARCPVCGKTAYGRSDIEDAFGFRYDGTMPQSWCRKCRSLGSSCGIQIVHLEDYPSCYYSAKCPINDD